MNEINPYQPQPQGGGRGAAMAKAIADVFQTLRAYYPKYSLVMKTGDQELSMMGEWGKALMLAKVNQEMLKSGINRAKTYAAEDKFCNWPAVSDFIAWCYGMPEPEDAYNEAAQHCHDLTQWEPSHPAVALVFELINRNDFRNSNEKHGKADYVRAYGKIRARVLTGEQLQYTKPEAPKRIEYSRTPESKEQGKQSLSSIKAVMSDGDAPQPKPEPEPIANIDEKKAAAIAKARAYLEGKEQRND